tara:strand:+ start:429 stop:677 length:249 start_codon:yes stop_codon:yes gene_type:complete
MQAIHTRYLGATNHRGERIVARAAAGRRVYDWDYALGPEGNHAVAAQRFCEDVWDGEVEPFHRGNLHDGSWVHTINRTWNHL